MTLLEFLSALFGSAFISATLLPGGSEVFLVWGISKWPDSLWLIVLTATLGNTLGAMTSYIIGRFIPNKVEAKSLDLVRKYGILSLLFSWVPVIGDGLCLAAGWLRMNWLISFVLILFGKLARYWILACGTSWFL